MSDSPSRSMWPRRTPEWVPGIFYPLVVAALGGILVTIMGLREDVAVIKVRVHTIENQGCLCRASSPRPQASWPHRETDDGS